MKGLEPPRLSAPDPKSGAATNYATSAFIANWVAKIRYNFELKQKDYSMFTPAIASLIFRMLSPIFSQEEMILLK